MVWSPLAKLKTLALLPRSWVTASPQQESHVYDASTSTYKTDNDSPIFPPPPPEQILAKRFEYSQLLRERRYRIPADSHADTPLFALYRLYECFVVDNVTGYRNALEYFWRQHDWILADIPDPKDHGSPSRYAFLACTVLLLVECFNEKIKLGSARDAPAIMTPEQAEAYRTKPESEKTYES